MAKPLSKGSKIALWILGALVGVILLVVIGLNIYVRAAYSTFYAEAQREFPIPGVSEGFINQDLDYYDPTGAWLFSGYTTDGGASPIYRLDGDGTSVRLYALLPDGSVYDGHGSAITTDDEFAFLSCEGGYLVFEAQDLAKAEDGSYVQAVGEVSLEITPAFMNIEYGVLYAGTFHLVPDYPAPDFHHLIAPDGSENAGVIFAYPADGNGPYGFSAQAAWAFSIPDAAQGMCVLPDGSIVTSSSWGLSTSHIRTYAVDLGEPAGTFPVDGNDVPLYFLDSTNLVADLEAPPMSEGIEYHDGKVYIGEESASNKYIFGKLYGAGYVYAVPMG